jgi:hypothetical protein
MALTFTASYRATGGMKEADWHSGGRKNPWRIAICAALENGHWQS